MKTRKEFEEFRQKEAEKMYADKELLNDALKLHIKADAYHWVHQSTWLGEPALQTAQDLLALQEIIYNTRPDYIVEIGLCWGGSALFYGTMMDIIGGKGIVGVDIFMPNDLQDRIKDSPIKTNVHLIEGSSIENSTFDKVKEIVKTGSCMVVLDSVHSCDHVFAELNLYSKLVSPGNYLICCDTYVEDFKHIDRNRPWGPGNSPRTALDKFLKNNIEFKKDLKIRNKLLISCHPDGYIKRENQ